jgi:serine/threonine protein kinase
MEKSLGGKQPHKAASLFGKYRLLRPLKRSPFLENYLAQAEAPPHEMVVLKRLHPLVIHRTDWVSLLLNEVKEAATLWHPNIIRIYDLGEVDGIPYFIQPYFFGKKLQTLLARSRSLPIPTGMALLLIRQILEALHFAHAVRGGSGRAIVHGGLHPERIFIGYDGTVRVGDFGLGWLEDPRSAIRSRYRAPESVLERKGGEIAEGTPEEDLFAASAILCELLGEFPEPVKPDMEPWRYLPASIRSILIRGLAFDPAARFRTAAEMIAPIESILQAEYPRLNLKNYIQAFFGKEIEAERRAFARLAPIEGEGAPSGEQLLFEQLASSTDLIPHTPAAASSTPPEPLGEPAPIEPPAVSAVIETVASLPTTSDLVAAGGTIERPSEVALNKKAPSWQQIWWGLFGLLMTGFVGVLLFSLYRPSSDQEVSAPPVPSPPVEAQLEPMNPPLPIVEERVEVKESVVFPEEEIAPKRPVSPELPPLAQAPVSVVEAVPPPAEEKPERDQMKKPAVLSAPKKDPPPAPGAASSEVSLVAARISPKLKEGLPPQPKVEEIPAKPKTNEEMLHELIERQRRAYQSQDWALYRQDVAEGKGFEDQIAKLFEGAEPVRVEFQIFQLKVQGEEADLSLMQTARLRTGKGMSLQKSLLFWKLKKEHERWRIEKFNIIEKYPPIEIG